MCPDLFYRRREAASDSLVPRTLALGESISVNLMFYARLNFLLETVKFISELP